MHTLARRTQSDITSDARLIPLQNIRAQSLTINIAALIEWSRKRKKYAAQILYGEAGGALFLCLVKLLQAFAL